MVTPKKCKRCGRKIFTEDNFCEKCMTYANEPIKPIENEDGY